MGELFWLRIHERNGFQKWVGGRMRRRAGGQTHGRTEERTGGRTQELHPQHCNIRIKQQSF